MTQTHPRVLTYRGVLQTAYEYVNRYLDTGGEEGIPAIRIGSSLRVPRWALVDWLTTGVLPRLRAHPVDWASSASRVA